MAGDCRVIGQTAKVVWFDPVFFHALIGVSRVIQMHRARCALNSMFAERIRTTKCVRLRCGPIHDQIFPVECEHLGLFLGLRRNERLEGLRRNDQHEHAIAQPIDDMKSLVPS